MSPKEPIKIGVVGVRRGRAFARGSEAATGLRLVALCDTWEERLEQERRELEARGTAVTTYTDYDRFLQHDMDAVVLANHFHEHAPLAIAALRSGAPRDERVRGVPHAGRRGGAHPRGGGNRQDLPVRGELSLHGLQPGDAQAVPRRHRRHVPVRRGRIRAPGQRAHQAGAQLRDGPLAQLDTGDVLLHALAGAGHVHHPTRAR